MVKASKPNKQRNDADDSCPAKEITQTVNSENAEVNNISTGAGPSTAGGQEAGTAAGETRPCKPSGSSEASTTGVVSSKRKLDSEPDFAPTSSKRQKKQKKGKQASSTDQPSRPNIRKLAPRRPFPTVPTSVSATGPRSAHAEGKNRICITRKTELGMYLRRCKDVVLKDGYKTLHLHAMGAAIPHLARLAVSLPSILPYAPSDIQTEVRTGTAEVQDELIPDDEDEDITFRTRGKSTMSVIIKIEGGDEEGVGLIAKEKAKGKRRGKQNDRVKRGSDKPQPQQLVFTEADLGDDDLSN